MSWFPQTTTEDERSLEYELLDGVVLERRQVIYLSLAALAALGFNWPGRALAGVTHRDDRTLAWNRFLEQAVPSAERVIEALAPNEEDYLRQLSALVRRLAPMPKALFEPSEPVASASTYYKFPFVVMQFKLAPGAAIPYHDHRDYNGVLKVVEGSARIRSFEILDSEKPLTSGKTFQIRATRDEFLTPGRLSSLSRTRDNIHDVRAGQDGARLIDFFTFFEKEAGSFYLNVDERARDPTGGIYDASWI